MFLPGARPDAQQLARAALALDDRRVMALLRAGLACDETVITWEDMITPVLAALGAPGGGAQPAQAAERLLSACAIAALTEIWAGITRPDGQPPVLLCCAEGEQHTLPLHALAASLADARVGCSLLGPGLPGAVLLAAARRVRPAAVCVWSQAPASADPSPLAVLAGSGLAGRVLAGGRGWQRDRLPAGVEPVSYLPEAVSAIRAALAGG